MAAMLGEGVKVVGDGAANQLWMGQEVLSLKDVNSNMSREGVVLNRNDKDLGEHMFWVQICHYGKLQSFFFNWGSIAAEYEKQSNG